MKRFVSIIAIIVVCIIVGSGAGHGQSPNNFKPGEYIQNIMPMRERVQLMQRWLEWKKENVLPMIMRELNVDLWIIRDNEADLYYDNEGPVYTSLLPADFQGMTFPSSIVNNVGDLSIPLIPVFMMFYDTGNEIEYVEPRDYEHIAELVRERDPRKIAIGKHNNEQMLEALGNKYASRSIDSWFIGVRWLETMSPEQMNLFRYVMGVHNDIIAEGFSNRAIIPGLTTTDDLNWWFRHRYLELDIEIENHPSIYVQRKVANIEKYPDPAESFSGGGTNNAVNVVIRRGDLVSIDSDIMLLGLVTDSHQFAYVLEGDETEVPAQLTEALLKANKLQDLISREFKVGRTGKEIEDASHAIPSDGNVHNYSGIFLTFHPPPMFNRRFLRGGYMFSHKTYVAGISSQPQYYPTSIVSDQHRLSYNTVHVFHPHVRVFIPGWEENGVAIGVGQIIAFTEDGFQYLNRPMENGFHVVR